MVPLLADELHRLRVTDLQRLLRRAGVAERAISGIKEKASLVELALALLPGGVRASDRSMESGSDVEGSDTTADLLHDKDNGDTRWADAAFQIKGEQACLCACVHTGAHTCLHTCLLTRSHTSRHTHSE